MTHVGFRILFIAALAAGLAACGPSGADRNAAHEGNAAHPAAGMRMHEAMASAVGADVSDTWLRKMIAHHEGAIEMADEAVADGRDPRVAAVARRMAAQQRQEIEEMRRLTRKDSAPDPASAQAYAAAEKAMHDRMTAAHGSDLSQTFLKRMIPHHQGAVDMSRIVLAQGRDERVAAIARRIVGDQQREIAEMQAMVR